MRALLLLPLLALPAIAQRQMDDLGRGVIAQRTGGSSTYIGWRMLGSDDDDIAFNLYRSVNGGAGVKLNGSPLTATTDYQDNPGSGTLDSSSVGYYVRPVVDGVEQPASATWTLPAGSATVPYFDVPFIGDPTPDGPYDTKFVWVGDFDADGEYDFLCDRISTLGNGYEQYLEAYLRDGTFLWRMNMGPNSADRSDIYRPGSSAISSGDGDNVTCFDLDGDGHAEAIVRTADGVTVEKPVGNVVTSITAASASDQFITVIDGMSGTEIDSAPVPNDWAVHGTLQSKCFIAYLDGKRPSIILYGYNRAASGQFYRQWTAWDFVGGSLVQRWTWAQDPSTQPGSEGHQVRIGDVDNDGRDEIIDIGHVMDDDGSQLYVTDVTHGDRFHVADIHPLRPGLETFLIQQTNPTYLATAYLDAANGNFYKKWYSEAVVDVGRGLTVDMDPNHLGMEMFSTQPGIFNADSDPIFANSFFPYEGLWWDGDTGREFIIGTNGPGTSPAINKFNPATGGQDRIYLNGQNIYNYGVIQAYGGRPAFWGDILGDWREELVFTRSDFSGLRILSTNTPADDRRRTLMHNAQYRVQTTTKGYVQASYVDYYLGFETTEDPPPPIDDTDHTWVAGPTFDATTCPDGESILFDLSGDNSQPVALSGTRSPSKLKVFSPIDYTFDGSAGSLAGPMRLLKSGAGSLTLTGSHPYTGATEVWDGALVIDGTLSTSPVTIHGGTWGGPLATGETGGRLGGSGTVGQPVTLAWRGAIAPGTGNGDAATLQLGSGLSCADATVISLDLANGPTSDLLAITGDLNLQGTTTLAIHPLDPTLDAGSYPLITYTGTFNGSLGDFDVSLPDGTPYSLNDTGSAIELVIPVTRAPDTLVWAGGANGNTWDLFNTPNFLLGGSPETFIAGDDLTFDDGGSPHTTVTLDGSLTPGSVTVDSSLDYTFTGTGTLDGGGGLTKAGTGTLDIGENHGFTGPVTVTGGTLAVTSLADGGLPSSIGAASTSPFALVLDGGTLRLDGPQASTNRGLRLEVGGGTLDTPGESLQIGGNINGAGSLTKTGAGRLIIGNGNSFGGGSFLDEGTLQLASDTANASGLGTGPITFRGGTLSMTDNSSSYNSASYELVVPAGETGRLNADSRVYLGGTLTGAGDFTLYSPFVRTDLEGDWSAFTGTLHVITDGDGGDFRIDNTHGYGGATVDLGPDIWAYYMPTMYSNLTLDLGALSGDAAATLNGGPTAGRTLTWRIGGKNVDATYEGAVNDGTATTALTKIGNGVQTFTGPLAHSGDTTISGGILRLEGTSSASDFIVENGGVLGGGGSITGQVTVNDGGALELGSSPLAIDGNLTAGGTVTIQPRTAVGTGTYVVATFSGSFTGSPTFVWTGAGTASFSTSGNQLSVTVSAPAQKVHHYTFNDGTFTDLVGSLDGTPTGSATMAGGALVLTGGTGELDASTLAINSFGSASFEFWATSDDAANTGFHALLGLGEVNPSNGGLASNYLIFTTHRGDDSIRGAIATNNQDGDPWTEEDGISTAEINDASEHHYVLTISGNQLELFVDGLSVGQQPTAQSLANVATELASLGTLYPNDAAWQGSINEFAIYSGTLNPSEVAAAHAAGPVPNPPTDSDGDLIPDLWETTYYPSPATAGPLDDTDGDGFNTWTEWKAGTDPTSDASVPGAAGPGSTTLEPVADAFIFHNDGGGVVNTTNFGTSAELDLYQQGTGLYAFSYVRFDLAALPPNATIDAATLSFTKVTNTNEGVDAARNDNLTTGRFGVWGLLDVSGNTPQDWAETGITADSVGSELTGGSNPQFDTSVPRSVSFDGIGESVSGSGVGDTASNADAGGGALTSFLQGRVDATNHSGLATFLVDFAENRTSGRGFAFGSREADAGSRPTLVLDYTGSTPLPDTDEDNDGLDDAWEAHHFGSFDPVAGDDADGDGTPEWLEQALGLDPHDRNEHFRATIGPDLSGDLLLTWPNAPGVTFTVESNDTLEGDWNPEATYPGASTPAEQSHPIDTTGTRNFYRIGASPSP